MNYLELVNEARSLCGLSNADLTTIVGAVDEDARFSRWVADEWRKIQMLHPDWEWMKKAMTFNTVAGTSSYSISTIGLSDFASWKQDSFRSYLTSAGQGTERFLDFYEDYEQFRDLWLYGTRETTQSMPVAITIKPDKSLLLALVPNGIYTIRGEYFSTVTALADDTDEPEMPERFHMGIVYKTMVRYAMFESAPEVLAEGTRLWAEEKAGLELDQLPGVAY